MFERDLDVVGFTGERVMEKGTSNINFKLIGLKFKLEMKNRI